jgi:hypothetical protein
MKKFLSTFSFMAITTLLFVGCNNTINEPNINSDVFNEGLLELFTAPAGDGLPVIIEPGITICGTSHTVDLWAGQSTDAGSVTIYNDDTNFYVTVYSDFGYQEGIDQLKMWVGGDLANLPRNDSGNPAPGSFPYKLTTTGGTTYTFTIPLNNLSLVNDCGDQIYVVIHADVLADDGNGGTTNETAFGGDTGGNTGSRWWYYTTYTIQCCTPPTAFDYSETAFAKGGWIFASGQKANPDSLESLQLTRHRWGWAINVPLENGQSNYEIWAGAGLNNTTHGTLVGTLTLTTSTTQVTVEYTLEDGFNMQEAHIYANDFTPTTIAPGQYGHTVYFDPIVSTYAETFNVSDIDDDGIWIIAHAVVCW